MADSLHTKSIPLPSRTSKATPSTRRVDGKRHHNWAGYLFIGPGVLLYLIFAVYPILRGFLMAFQDYRFLKPATRNPLNSFNGLENWFELASDPTFWHSFRVALLFTLGTFPATLILGLASAVLIAGIHNRRLEAVTRVVVYLPVILPVSVAMLIWGLLYQPGVGFFSYFVTRVIPIWETAPAWLGFDWALPSAMVAWIWKQFGFNTLLFLIGIYGIPKELYEAAAIDGANGWNRFRHITLPSLKAVFTLVFVLNAGIVSATEQMMILTGGGPAEETLTTGLYAYYHAFSIRYGDMRMGYAAAMMLVLGLIHTILSGAVFRLMKTEQS